jgi:hypothetical protein
MPHFKPGAFQINALDDDTHTLENFNSIPQFIYSLPFFLSLTEYESGKRGSRPVGRFLPTTARLAKNLSTEILT